MWENLWDRCPGCPPPAQGPGDLLSSGFLMMSAVLFPAEVTVGPLLALSLQGYVRGSPALPSGPRSTPPSFSSSSSTDGDLDFQSPGGSQGRPPGKGELAGLRLGVSPGEAWETSLTQPGQAAMPRVWSRAGEVKTGADRGLAAGWQWLVGWGGGCSIHFSDLAPEGQDNI